MSVERLETPNWVFYIDHEALPALSYERVGKWMYRTYKLEHGLVQRTRTGRLYDIPFKFDEQTRAGEYGASFHARITLSDFVDLETGSFIC